MRWFFSSFSKNRYRNLIFNAIMMINIFLKILTREAKIWLLRFFEISLSGPWAGPCAGPAHPAHDPARNPEPPGHPVRTCVDHVQPRQWWWCRNLMIRLRRWQDKGENMLKKVLKKGMLIHQGHQFIRFDAMVSVKLMWKNGVCIFYTQNDFSG